MNAKTAITSTLASLALSSVLTLAASLPSAAQETNRRVVTEDLPSLHTIKRVSASNTHSGYLVPRYVSLKFNRVNGRQGPSLKHPAVWQYQRLGMPLVVVAEMDIWRKIRDMHGDESWVRTQALSGKRTVVMLQDVALRRKPKSGARAVALAKKDALLHLLDCNAENWCQVKSDTGHKGWARRGQLWGAEPL